MAVATSTECGYRRGRTFNHVAFMVVGSKRGRELVASGRDASLSPVQSPPEKHESDVDDLEDTVVEAGPSSPRKSIEHVPTSDLEEEEIERKSSCLDTGKS